MAGSNGADRQPVAATTHRHTKESPPSVSTVHSAARLVPGERRYLGLELDVPAEVEAVGNPVEVALELGLGGHELGPLPLLLEVVVEGVGVLDALDVDPGPGVPVPVPGAAHAVTRFQGPYGKAGVPQLLYRVQAGVPSADDDDLETAGHAAVGRSILLEIGHLIPLSPRSASATSEN